MAQWTEKTKPVGLTEVAQMTGFTLATVRSMRYKGLLPEAEATVSGNPVWRTEIIESWNTKRQAEIAKRKDAQADAKVAREAEKAEKAAADKAAKDAAKLAEEAADGDEAAA